MAVGEALTTFDDCGARGGWGVVGRQFIRLLIFALKRFEEGGEPLSAGEGHGVSFYGLSVLLAGFLSESGVKDGSLLGMRSRLSRLWSEA